MNARRPRARTGRFTSSLLAWLILAGLTIMLLDLVNLATAAPRLGGQVLDRSAAAVVAVEQHARRGGNLTSLPIRF